MSVPGRLGEGPAAASDDRPRQRHDHRVDRSIVGTGHLPAIRQYRGRLRRLAQLGSQLHEAVKPSGVYAAHVAIAAWIGGGNPDAEPDVIAESYWELQRNRETPALFYEAMETAS